MKWTVFSEWVMYSMCMCKSKHNIYCETSCGDHYSSRQQVIAQDWTGTPAWTDRQCFADKIWRMAILTCSYILWEHDWSLGIWLVAMQ